MTGVEQKKVIIVGAGISGLKAASDLIKSGITDILIVEARNRIGGRLLTLKTPEGNTYDLGASWFHDTLSNPLFKKYVIKENHTQIHYDDITSETYSYSDTDPKGFTIPRKWGLETVLEELEKFVEMENYTGLENKDNLLYNTVGEYLSTQRKVLTKEQIMYTPELLRNIEFWHGISWKMISSKYSIDENEGRNALNLDGYSKILSDMLSSIPEETVKTGIQVKQIEKFSDKIVLTTAKNEVIVADYVIVTVPQSILALPISDPGSIIFKPPLPKYISSPLQHMHFSALGKIVLEFKSVDDIFWDKDIDKFTVLATPDPAFKEFAKEVEEHRDNVNAVEVPDQLLTPVPFDLNDEYYDYEKHPENIPNIHEHPISFMNYYTAKQLPALIAFIQAPVTNYVEKISYEDAWEFLKPALFVLASQCKSKNHKIKTMDELPIPKNIFKTNWTRDPFSRGSYAGCAPGDDPTELIVGLSKGFGHNLRFAGEHTIFEGAGCAHGAWLSGKREANYILDNLGMLQEENTYIDE